MAITMLLYYVNKRLLNGLRMRFLICDILLLSQFRRIILKKKAVYLAHTSFSGAVSDRIGFDCLFAPEIIPKMKLKN